MHSRARLLNVSNRDGIVLAWISISTRPRTQTQPLPSAPSIALHTLLVNCPPYMSAIVTDESAVVQRCCRRCLEDSPCAMTRTTSCLRHWLSPLYQERAIDAFLDRIGTVGDGMQEFTPCVGRYHGMRCHREVSVLFSLPRTLTDIRTPSGYSSSRSTPFEREDHREAGKAPSPSLALLDPSEGQTSCAAAQRSSFPFRLTPIRLPRPHSPSSSLLSPFPHHR